MSWAKDQYRKRGLARYAPKEAPRKWNNRERWRTARLVIRLVLAYSPRSVGTALIVAGYLIQAIDRSWEKPSERTDNPAGSKRQREK